VGKNLIQLGQVSLPGNDSGPMPVTQVQSYGQASDVLVVWPYGMHGNLPVDSYTISWSINGQQENRAVIGFKPDIRQKNLKEGEVIFGNFVRKSTTFYDDDGNIIVNCENDEKVTIKGASIVNITGNASLTIGGAATIDVTGNTTLTTPLATVDGDLTVTGNLTVETDTILGANVTSNGKDISDTHTHVGSPTAPSGAQSNTGAVN